VPAVPAASVVSGGTACSKYSLPTCKHVQSSAIQCTQVHSSTECRPAIGGHRRPPTIRA
jgi:hypothetical protein